jgi:hypothetical protein
MARASACSSGSLSGPAEPRRARPRACASDRSEPPATGTPGSRPARLHGVAAAHADPRALNPPGRYGCPGRLHDLRSAVAGRATAHHPATGGAARGVGGARVGGPAWQTTPSFVDQGELVVAATREQGLEGVVAKRLGGPYRPGRRHPDWRKLAHDQQAVFVVGGYVPGQPGSSGCWSAPWMSTVGCVTWPLSRPSWSPRRDGNSPDCWPDSTQRRAFHRASHWRPLGRSGGADAAAGVGPPALAVVVAYRGWESASSATPATPDCRGPLIARHQRLSLHGRDGPRSESYRSCRPTLPMPTRGENEQDAGSCATQRSGCSADQASSDMVRFAPILPIRSEAVRRSRDHVRPGAADFLQPPSVATSGEAPALS